MKKVKVELTQEEHTLITAVLMMHHTGIIVEVKNELIHKVAKDFSLRDFKQRVSP